MPNETTQTETTETDITETYPRPTEPLSIVAADLFREKVLAEAKNFVDWFLKEATLCELQLLTFILRERDALAGLTDAPKELLPDAVSGCLGLVPNSWQRVKFNTVSKWKPDKEPDLSAPTRDYAPERVTAAFHEFLSAASAEDLRVVCMLLDAILAVRHKDKAAALAQKEAL